MLALDDPRWPSLDGGNHAPFDASPWLRALKKTGPTPKVWEALYAGLYHQGDVDQASYAAVPHLLEYLAASETLDELALALVAVVELYRPYNPAPLPELQAAYRDAIDRLPSLIADHRDRAWDVRTTQAAVACIALARGRRRLASVYLDLDVDACAEALLEAGINVLDD